MISLLALSLRSEVTWLAVSQIISSLIDSGVSSSSERLAIRSSSRGMNASSPATKDVRSVSTRDRRATHCIFQI